MKNTKATLFLLLTALILGVLAACSSQPTTVEVRVVETVEVPYEVTVIVEKVVEVPVDSSGSPLEGVELATPTPTLPPTPTPRATPAEVGEVGDFDDEDLDRVREIWDLVESEFYGPLPTDEVLTTAIIQAIVEQLGDDHTNYFPPDVAQRIQDGFRGDFEGIGAYVNTNDAGEFFIVRPIPGTPAMAAGLKPNDVVTHVDGESISGYATDEVIAIVRGPRGEPVTLTIRREGVEDTIDITIVRDRIIVPVVEAQTRADGKIGYVHLLSFNQLATDQLESEIGTFIDNGVESLILDLRDNGGGLLTQAVSVGDLFLDRGLFLIVRDSDGREDEFETTNGELAEEIPMVVLINENSASASEIVAAALKERGRATVIGTNSFGKGSVQTPYSLDDGAEFRVTTARFYSPADNVIHGQGVSPQIFSSYVPEIIGEEGDETVDRAG